MPNPSFPARTTVLWLAFAWSGWWILALWPTFGHWGTNPQYSYGWLVPALALVLAWRRTQWRPAAEAPASWSLPLIVVAAAMVLPAWLVAQPNPGWRITPWLLVSSAAAGTLGLAARLGGRRWAAWFAFPIVFVFTAVPWPSLMEEPIVQGLMRFVAAVTVIFLNLAQIPAMQHGNLVEVSAGTLGVDEACSGVRSLQATLMATLFLGEFHQLRRWPRVMLMLVGFLGAIGANIVRTSFLSVSAARNGLQAVDRWHDSAGYSVLIICLIVVALAAEWMRRRSETAFPEPSPARTTPQPCPPWLGIALVCWLGVVFGASALWYHRDSASSSPGWTITLPPTAQEKSLPTGALELLGCDRTLSAVWRDATGGRWQIYFLEWFPAHSRTTLLSQVHRPEVCLPGVGMIEVGPRQFITASAAGFELAFQSMHFRDPAGADVYVFYCPWEFGPGEVARNAAFSDATRHNSLRRVWNRERILGQQVLELILTDAPSREDGEAVLRLEISKLVRPTISAPEQQR